ncbi:restriction endonuclease subunit S [Microbacterium sp. C7(2022)]|uniref:restriction endonuclease subunit S n=1 Tax=Microbacterium sp. C7(2022) TaxID=2992759 RepID=UPI00237B6DB6|nr:restriction endonuclease subunit S [Microbacterium sp. C7(2022)]MDE0546345.1 restriction endonuclease subunit S [Microbacterium sp. C7(2022)]
MNALPDGWTRRRVEELVRVTRGASPRPINDWIAHEGTPWVKISDATASRARVISATREFIRNEGRARSVVVHPGDLIVSNSATPGIPRFMGIEACIHDGWLLLRDLRGLDPSFMYYTIENDRSLLLEQGNGSIFTNLKTEILKRHQIAVPPLAEQQAIAEVLSALDDKIAANTALAERADELMHRTFRSMTAASEVPLSGTADFVNGKAFTKGASGTGRVVVRIAELNGGISGSTVFSDAIVDDKHVARPGDILFAWSGSLTLHRWFRDEAIVNQHIFKVIPRDRYPAWLVYELVRQKLVDFKAIAADKATTMGHIQRHHLDEVVGIPFSSEVDRLNPLMSALWGAALNAEQESRTLAATRDALLPQLMSGKLRVRDAEEAASAAGV